MPKKKKIINPNKVDGRPTKYLPKYIEDIKKFFNVTPTREVLVTKTDAKGNKFDVTEERMNRFPTFERWASDHDVCIDTVLEWCKVHADFSESYKLAKQYQKDFLIQNGLSGKANAAFSIFTAKNCTDMRDEIGIGNAGGVPFSVNLMKYGEGDFGIKK